MEHHIIIILIIVVAQFHNQNMYCMAKTPQEQYEELNELEKSLWIHLIEWDVDEKKQLLKAAQVFKAVSVQRFSEQEVILNSMCKIPKTKLFRNLFGLGNRKCMLCATFILINSK